MDKLISEEERIRRAEDILERRKNTNLRISSDNFGKEKQNPKTKKMLIQILICLLIYCGIYYVKNSQNQSLKVFMSNLNNVLEYDVDFKKIYTELNLKYQSLNKKFNNSENNKENVQENSQEKNQKSSPAENSNNDVNNNKESSDNINKLEEQSTENEVMGIGGSEEETSNEEVGSLTEEGKMLSDAEFIKSNYSMINPLSSGIVTSRFGSRKSSEIVSANHKGIDLGASTGTEIISAMDGIVSEASSKGDFGLHLKIVTGDITVIYAHCSELLVKEGDTITQGQKIGKVGSTGKATGPHLHFEIRRLDRAINPEYLLEF